MNPADYKKKLFSLLDKLTGDLTKAERMIIVDDIKEMLDALLTE